MSGIISDVIHNPSTYGIHQSLPDAGPIGQALEQGNGLFGTSLNMPVGGTLIGHGEKTANTGQHQQSSNDRSMYNMSIITDPSVFNQNQLIEGSFTYVKTSMISATGAEQGIGASLYEAMCIEYCNAWFKTKDGLAICITGRPEDFTAIWRLHGVLQGYSGTDLAAQPSNSAMCQTMNFFIDGTIAMMQDVFAATLLNSRPNAKRCRPLDEVYIILRCCDLKAARNKDIVQVQRGVLRRYNQTWNENDAVSMDYDENGIPIEYSSDVIAAAVVAGGAGTTTTDYPIVTEEDGSDYYDNYYKVKPDPYYLQFSYYISENKTPPPYFVYNEPKRGWFGEARRVGIIRDAQLRGGHSDESIQNIALAALYPTSIYDETYKAARNDPRLGKVEIQLDVSKRLE